MACSHSFALSFSIAKRLLPTFIYSLFWCYFYRRFCAQFGANTQWNGRNAEMTSASEHWLPMRANVKSNRSPIEKLRKLPRAMNNFFFACLLTRKWAKQIILDHRTFAPRSLFESLKCNCSQMSHHFYDLFNFAFYFFSLLCHSLLCHPLQIIYAVSNSHCQLINCVGVEYHLPLELCCLASLMTYSRSALEPGKISPSSCQISSCAPSHRQCDPFGNSPTAPRFDRALGPTGKSKQYQTR